MSINNQKFWFVRFLLVLCLTVSLAGINITSAVADPGDIILISKGGVPSPPVANGTSQGPSISADGRYVAFDSDATNLVNNDTNFYHDVFVFDRQTGLPERVSVDSNGMQANYRSFAPSISADGRYVAFVSDASNLVNGDTNNTRDIFVHDRETGVTERIIPAPHVSGQNTDHGYPSISADGRYVLFWSPAGLVDGDTNGMNDIYLFDRQTGLTEYISMGSAGMQANKGSYAPSISADGRYVSFESDATNLVEDDTNNQRDIFLFDRQTGTTERVSVDSIGMQANFGSAGASITADARFVVFASAATNLVSDDTNNRLDVFLHDRQTGLTERISVDSTGVEGAGHSDTSSISGDGRYIAFASFASNLVSEDTNNTNDIFLHDRETGITKRISLSSSGAQGDGNSDWPVISADGGYVAFESDSKNLGIGDINEEIDIFVRDLQTDHLEHVSVGPVVISSNSSSFDPKISADGRYTVFQSLANHLVVGDTNGLPDVFVHDRQTDSIERVSVSSSGIQLNYGSSSLQSVISSDGRYIAFSTRANQMVENDTNYTWDVFVHDRQAHITERVSIGSNGAEANGESRDPAISADGRYIVFTSGATNLISNDTNNMLDIFLYDREMGARELISISTDGMPANNHSYSPVISADGRYVAFMSRANNLVNGDTNSTDDIFVFDRQTGLTERISVDSNGVQANNTSMDPSISADGRYVSFLSSASNLVIDDLNGVNDIFIHDRQIGITDLISVHSNGTQANKTSQAPSISGDGRYIAFASDATNLVENDTNNTFDIFIHDHQVGMTRRVSVDARGLQANKGSGDPSISANGQFVAFASSASNLVIGDENNASDVFIHENDLSTQVVRSIRVDRNPTNATKVNFTVTFSEPVTGVDTTAPFDDFSLMTTGVNGAFITGVSGSGNTYTVTVNTGSGNGTIRLDVKDDDSILDAFNNPLGGVGSGNGDFTTGAEYSIIRSAPKPSVPVLTSPVSGAVVPRLQPLLDWKESLPAAHHYQIQLAKDKAFTAVVVDHTNILETQFIPATDLEAGQRYYWRVRALNVLYGTSGWSAVRNFKTPLDPPVIVSPENYASLLTDRPIFDWHAVPGATQYILQVSAVTSFSTLLVNQTVTGTEYKLTKDLPQNKNLYWKVRSMSAVMKSPWVGGPFKTGNPPSVPVLTAPANGALVIDYTPFLDWKTSTVPTGTTFKHYELQVDDQKDFSSPEITTLPVDSNFTPLTDLASNTKYYWHVRAVNTMNGNDHVSGWSPIWSFRTVIPAPGSLTLLPNAENPERPSFAWDDATGDITGYTIQISTSANFSALLVNSTTIESTYTIRKDLPVGKTIYWRVRVNGVNGPSAWTKASFTLPLP